MLSKIIKLQHIYLVIKYNGFSVTSAANTYKRDRLVNSRKRVRLSCFDCNVDVQNVKTCGLFKCILSVNQVQNMNTQQYLRGQSLIKCNKQHITGKYQQ